MRPTFLAYFSVLVLATAFNIILVKRANLATASLCHAEQRAEALAAPMLGLSPI